MKLSKCTRVQGILLTYYIGLYITRIKLLLYNLKTLNQFNSACVFYDDVGILLLFDTSIITKDHYNKKLKKFFILNLIKGKKV